MALVNKYEHLPLHLQEYLIAVEKLAESKSKYVFKNSNSDHACAVLATILNFSEKEVRIYDDSLNGDIADKHDIFNNALDKFVYDGKILKIVVRNGRAQKSTIYDKLKTLSIQSPSSIMVRVSSETFTKAIGALYERKDINFSVGDRAAFRMETFGTGLLQKSERTAICGFNNPEYAEPLADCFDKNFDGCTNVVFE